MMCHFHNIVSVTVHPKIDIAQLAQEIVAFEPGKGDDPHIEFFGTLGDIDHVG